MYVKKHLLSLALFLVLNGCTMNISTDSPVATIPILSLSPTPPTPYTQIPTAESTPLPLTPSPSPLEVEKRIAEFLQNNGSCKFPCFWGLIPEETSHSQVEGFFNDFGRKGFVCEEGSHISESTTFAFKEYGRVYLELSTQDNTLTYIKITLDNLWNPEVEYQDWSAYNLDQILRTYGTPTTAELFLAFVNNLVLYDIRLTYAGLNTSIVYGYVTEYATVSEGNQTLSQVELCSEEEISSVVIKIGENSFNSDLKLTPMSESTNLDETSFYELFTEDPFACFMVDLEETGR